MEGLRLYTQLSLFKTCSVLPVSWMEEVSLSGFVTLNKVLGYGQNFWLQGRPQTGWPPKSRLFKTDHPVCFRAFHLGQLVEDRTGDSLRELNPRFQDKPLTRRLGFVFSE